MANTKIDFDPITIVAIHGHNDGSKAIPALMKSLEELPGSHGLLISLSKPKMLPSSIQWIKVLPMDYRQYSLFVMFSLHHFIESEFCLIVQEDGWVINGANWSASFFDYDYIGAPCHAACIGTKLSTKYQWVNNPSAIPIQNGGFSLRSRKLLKAPSTLGALYYFTEEPILQGEDVQLSGIFRPALERNGIKFAPTSIARSFALEYAGHQFHNDLLFENLVGIHGKTRQLISHDTIRVPISENEVIKQFREKELLAYLKNNLGYKIQYG